MTVVKKIVVAACAVCLFLGAIVVVVHLITIALSPVHAAIDSPARQREIVGWSKTQVLGALGRPSGTFQRGRAWCYYAPHPVWNLILPLPFNDILVVRFGDNGVVTEVTVCD